MKSELPPKEQAFVARFALKFLIVALAVHAASMLIPDPDDWILVAIGLLIIGALAFRAIK